MFIVKSILVRKSKAHYAKENPRQMELESMIVKLFIVELGLPMSIVDWPAFSRAMYIVDPHFSMPSRRSITRSALPALPEQMVIDIKTRCLTVSYVAASVDC